MATIDDVIADSVSHGTSARTVNLATGGNINTVLSGMRGGDILNLAAAGSYTLAGDVNGFITLPKDIRFIGLYAAGHPVDYFTINGNNSTVNGGLNTCYLTNLSYFKNK